ncbi:MAG: PAS domain S-box protein, partial [Chitinophagaceae bacterium]|nr:PAS domain S-box protein [Rubrivivax sp.]
MSTPDDDARWRLLFQHNPQPMWIFDVETLRFLAVNDAAVAHYGWSVAEFAAMTIKDIRPADEVAALLEDLAQGHTGLDGARLWRHRKKDGQLIHVEITAHSVPFEGRAGRLVLAQDVTRRVLAEQALRSS